jgi:hypothetical protein
MLKRYWLVIDSNNKFGPKNWGVSAISTSQARNLIKDTARSLGWTHISSRDIDEAEIIENIDLNILDQNHVIPNIGIVVHLGVWFPNYNTT